VEFKPMHGPLKVRSLAPGFCGRAARAVLLLGTCLWCSCTGPICTQNSEDAIGPKVQGQNQGLPTTRQAERSRDPSQEPNSGPLRLTVGQATLLALENNRSLQVERFSPQIQRTLEQTQLAAFDPVLTGGVSQGRDRVASGPTPFVTSGTSVSVGAQEFLPTGTTLGLSANTSPVAVAGADGNDLYA
jgi:hypothetical protein